MYQSQNLASQQADASKQTSTGSRKPRKPRGRGLRTTTGCAVCRRRHMKCDEIKPVCGPCAKGNRDCVYGVVNKSPSQKAGSTSDNESCCTRPSGTWQPPVRPALHHGGHALNSHAHGEDSKFSPYSNHAIPTQPWNVPSHPLADLQRRSPISDVDPTSYSQAYEETIHTPVSNLSGGSEAAPFRWFGLLADDASLDDDFRFPFRMRSDYAHSHRSGTDSPSSPSFIPNYPTPQMQSLGLPHLPSQRPSMPTPVPRSSVPTGDERELWQAPITLSTHETELFQRFVDDISKRLDLYDPLKHFSTYVPQLALNNEGLMKSILALSARHHSLKPINGDSEAATVDRNVSVQYYYETLQYLQRAMKYESYTKSDDIIATALIVSTYEMIDGAGKSWERHLKGVFWIQRSQDNDGESGGLRQAVWWAWLRQDIWAAFREGRRCFSFWKPSRPYHSMDQYDLACRITYLLSQTVNYCSAEERKVAETNMPARIQRADDLLVELEEWKRHLTVHFQPLPATAVQEDGVFQPIWINPPAIGGALQMYHFARILLLVQRPAPGGFVEYSSREKDFNDAIDAIAGIAMTIRDDATSIVSSQALFCAGVYTQDAVKRQAIAKLIHEHQSRTAWPVQSLAEDLRQEWATSAAPMFFPSPPESDGIPGDQYFTLASMPAVG